MSQPNQYYYAGYAAQSGQGQNSSQQQQPQAQQQYATPQALQQYAQPAQQALQPYVQPAQQAAVQSQDGMTTSTTTQTIEQRYMVVEEAQPQYVQQLYQQVPPPTYTPLPPPSAPQPVQQVTQANYNHLMRSPPPATPAPLQQSNASTTSTHQTTRQTVSSMGGVRRQAAAAQGTAELQRFDTQVNAMLVAASSICPFAYPYYKCDGGYLCGGGHHFVADSEVDALLDGRRPWGHPEIEMVNHPRDPQAGRLVAPPPNEGLHEPMHMCYAHCIEQRDLRAEVRARLGLPGPDRSMGGGYGGFFC